MTRIDPHRPSAINSDEYEFVGCDCLPSDESQRLQEERRLIREHMHRTGGGYSRHEHGGVCHICGNANAIWTTIWHHRPTNTYIRVGSNCAEKMEFETAESFNRMKRLRASVADARKAVAGRRKAEALLQDVDLAEAWAIHNGDAQGREEDTIRDIINTIIRKGQVSEKQASFLTSLLGRIHNRAAEAAKVAAAADVPQTEGRVTIRGEVLGIKSNEYTMTLKMLVQHVDGYKLWGSLPAAMDDNARGKMIEFCAQITRSDRDPKFGFFRRPTKVKVIEG